VTHREGRAPQPARPPLRK